VNKQIGAQGHPDLSEDCVFSGTDERLNLQVGVFQGSWHSFESLRCLITLTLYEGVQNSVSPKLKSAMRSSRRPSKCIANCDSVRFQFCTGCVQRSDALSIPAYSNLNKLFSFGKPALFLLSYRSCPCTASTAFVV